MDWIGFDGIFKDCLTVTDDDNFDSIEDGNDDGGTNDGVGGDSKDGVGEDGGIIGMGDNCADDDISFFSCCGDISLSSF